MAFDYSAYLQHQSLFLYLGIGFVLLSIICFETLRNKNYALFFLLLGALLLRIFIALADPFLHMWDEQIHAVVAKHMMTHPFKPMLFENTLLGYDFKNWTANHIWLHKQPLFLWQMALSMKLFGVKVFALRLPSVLLSTVVVYFVYRMGSLLYSRASGFYAGVLLAGSAYIIQLVGGRFPTDHNDIAFLFYVTGSLWAWTEYEYKKRFRWLVFTGLFAGGAVLVKWLPGLLVFAGWAMHIVFVEKDKPRAFAEMMKSFLVSVLVIAPWQVYTLIAFPQESRYEMAFNSRHFFKVIEGHGGTWAFHLQQIPKLYGVGWPWILAFAFLIFLFVKLKRPWRLAILSDVVIVYLFYSLAATKMDAFTLMVASLVYLVTGIALSWVLQQLTQRIKKTQVRIAVKAFLAVSILSFLFLQSVDKNRLNLSETPKWKKIYAQKIQTTWMIKNLPATFSGGKFYFFNMKDRNYLKLLFYTDFSGRGDLPTSSDVAALLHNGYTPVVFDDGKLPPWLLQNHAVMKFRTSLQVKAYHGPPEIYR
jgi:4-amino-4-deoxy-L-arabinose transferase-like glycosyltransferase